MLQLSSSDLSIKKVFEQVETVLCIKDGLCGKLIIHDD